MTQPEPSRVAAGSTPTRTAARAEPPLKRFDVRERLLHWVNATLFGTLMLTGAALYAGPISTLVGHRPVVRFIHVYSGLLLPFPLLLAIAGRRGRMVRTDLSRLNRWSRDDARWLRRKRRADVQLGKFNPGQKLNAAFVAGAGIVMLATGSIMHWFNAFSLDWRTGATFVHDWFALAIWAVVLGHIFYALRDSDSLDSMLTSGTVPARWARTHTPLWYEEVTGTPVPEPRVDETTPSGAEAHR
jgi:formate dehydrogenase subunit gamma